MTVASPLSGGGGGPDPYGPELLTNVEMAGYVAGSPGTNPTDWLSVQSTGSLAAPTLTFDTASTRRAIYQTFAVTAGVFKLETTVTVNSGTVQAWDAFYYAAPSGSTVAWYVDDVLSAGSAAITGTQKLTPMITVITGGTLEFRIGAGAGGNRTQNITHINPSLQKAN